jgi:hypothetical protein
MAQLRPEPTPEIERAREPQPPEAHYAEADRLLGELDGLDLHVLSLPFNQMKLAKARVHAMLAQCVLPDYRDINDEPLKLTAPERNSI